MNCITDTHALIWYLFALPELSATAKVYMDRVADAGGFIFVPAISVVEIIYLVERNRLGANVLTRINNTLQIPDGVLKPIELSHPIAISLAQIPRLTVPDMPDRIITATALYFGLPLVTKDSKVRNLTNIKTIW